MAGDTVASILLKYGIQEDPLMPGTPKVVFDKPRPKDPYQEALQKKIGRASCRERV